MKKSRFSETQILNILKAVESGRTARDVCRENGYIERFNRSYRTEVLDMYLFRTLDGIREITEVGWSNIMRYALMNRWAICHLGSF